MGHPRFHDADFLSAARDVVAESGPAAVTVGSVTQRLAAPTGSFYHRFESREILMGRVWLAAIESFQNGYVAAVKAGDGLEAALHIPAWSRQNLSDASVLLLYSRRDFIQGEWPEALKSPVEAQWRRVERCFKTFARQSFGGSGREALRLSKFVLSDIPVAAVRPHLERQEPPPPLVDELIRVSYTAVLKSHGH